MNQRFRHTSVQLVAAFIALVVLGLNGCGNDSDGDTAQKDAKVVTRRNAKVVRRVGDRQVTPKELAAINKALDVFWKVCVPVAGARWSKVASVEARFDDYPAYRKKRYGWHELVWVRPTMKEAAGGQPFDGQTFNYALGGGKKPGILAGKRGGKILCGLPGRDHGDDTRRPVPALAFMK